MSSHSVKDWMMDLRLQVNRVDDVVEEVERHIADGKLDSAALVLNLSTSKVAELRESYASLQASLRDEGADAQRALDAM